jgi:predicted DNA-binding transcriptional regulator AlpA
MVNRTSAIGELEDHVRVLEQAAKQVASELRVMDRAVADVRWAIRRVREQQEERDRRPPPPLPASDSPAVTGPERAPREVLRLKDVATLVGLSRTTIWRFERDGKFPKRRRLSVNAVGWMASDVRQWVAERRLG